MSSDNKLGSAHNTPKEDPAWAERWTPQNIKKYKDELYTKISELLITNWHMLEPYIDGNSIEALQKTYRDGKLTTRTDDSDVLVIYESDVDANTDGEKIENLILDFMEFTDISQLNLSVAPTAEVEEGNIPNPPELKLILPDKELNLNEIIGTLDLNEINIKNNISQFIKIDKSKTNIDRSKFSELIDVEISELTPITFTHLLEKYDRIKNQIPFYRHRTDGFFNEYINSVDVPLQYRVEKFFEEFERIKQDIPKGLLSSYSSLIEIPSDSLTAEQLFGWETLTYLISQAQTLIGTLNPIFSQADALSWVDEIDILTDYGIEMSGSWDICEKRIRGMDDAVMSATGSVDQIIQYEFEEEDVPTVIPDIPKEGVTIHAIGTGNNNHGPRKLYINDQTVYVQHVGSAGGFRITVFSAQSIAGGSWDGSTIYDNIFNTYNNDSIQTSMAQTIFGDNWKMNDIFVITSYKSINYNALLVSALKSIGGCNPRLVNGIGSTLDSPYTGTYQDPDTSEGAIDWGAPGDHRTPYVLIGSRGVGECSGYEAVGDDGPDTPPAEVSAFWVPDLDVSGGLGGDRTDEDPNLIYGCTDETASNYIYYATEEDGSCEYEVVEVEVAGCMIQSATNWDVVKNPQWDYCKSPDGYQSGTECSTDSTCISQHGSGWTCDASCEYAEDIVVQPEGCTVAGYWNYNSSAIIDDGSCKCWGTEPFNGGPPPYFRACQPGPDHPGTQNMSSCTCTYPNISVSWSRLSSNCHNYSSMNTKADCDCWCQSSTSLVANVHHSDLGDCSVAFESDEDNCKNKCNSWCATHPTSHPGTPTCTDDQQWTGTQCLRRGGRVGVHQTGGPISAVDDDYPDIMLPTPKSHLPQPRSITARNVGKFQRGGRTRPVPIKRVIKKGRRK